MDKIKYVRLEQKDGTYSSLIPLSIDSNYIDIDGNTLTDVLATKADTSAITVLSNKIDSLSSGSPLVANSIEDMVDTNKVYINIGNGKWYYYNGTEWAEGGIYQAIVNDDASNDIENISFDNFKIENNYAETMNLYKGKSIIFATGASADNAARARTPKFTSKEMKLAILDSDTYVMMIFHYSGNSSTFTNDYIGHSNDWGNRFYTSSSPYFILAFKRVDGANLTDSDIIAIRDALMFYQFTDKNLEQDNAPADAKIVGDKITSVNNNIKNRDKFYNSFDNVDYVQNTLVFYNHSNLKTADGSIANDDNKRARTGRNISVRQRGNYITLTNLDYQFGIRYYADNNQNPFYAGYVSWRNELWVGEYPYIGVTFRRVDENDLTDADIDAIRSSLHFYQMTDKTSSIENAPADAKIVGSIKDTINSMNKYYQPFDNRSYVNDTLSILVGSSISENTGETFTSANRCRTGRLISPKNRGARIAMDGDTYLVGIRYYKDSSEIYPDSYAGFEPYGNEFWVGKYPYIGLVFKRIDNAVMTNEDVNAIKENLHFYKIVDNTLSQSNVAADAKVVGDKFKEISNNIILPNVNPTINWEQGSIAYSDGSYLTRTDRLRTQDYLQFYNCSSITVNCPDGYKGSYRIYIGQNYDLSASSTTFFKGEIQIPLKSDYRIKFIFAKDNDSTITPEDVPNDFTIVGEENVLEETNMDDFMNLLLENGSKENIKWEQGTIFTNGTLSNSDVRIRTKFYQSFDSVKYLYVHCPTNMKFGYRSYWGNSAATYDTYSKFLTGMQIIKLDQKHIYKFIVGFSDDSNITPATLPDDFYIVPVYFPIWENIATGKSVGPYTTSRNNKTLVNEMLAVAKTYYDHRNDTISGTSNRTMIYGVDHSVLSSGNVIEDIPQLTREIDCSTFVGLVLRGIEYTDTAYHTQIPRLPKEYIQNENYDWSLNPFDYENINSKADADVKPVRTAGQIGQWMIDQRRAIPIDKNLANLEPGDIIFWSRESGGVPMRPNRFNMINHIAICYSKRRPTQQEINNGYPYPYWHEFIEVTSATPCVQITHVERDWDNPNKLDRNNVNTISLICRPDLGSL